MRTDRCSCGNRLYFGNTQCLQCGQSLGFLPEIRRIVPLNETVKRCANHTSANCNWLIKAEQADSLCLACRLTLTIPDLDTEQNRHYWRKLESAKRYLICDLVRLDLPIIDRHQDPERGLAIDFLADQDTAAGVETITTGHLQGRITINIAEADDVHREQQRVALGEVYRTLLGHLRHESGHYYWMRLVENTDQLLVFRQLFGDERVSYTDAMAYYYQNGPTSDWSLHHISAYASAHPWEDWAETWAHYLHITDAMETARDFGLVAPRKARGIDCEITRWGDLSQALNALSRSVGVADPYPFAITPRVAEKLRFIHELIAGAGSGGSVANNCPSPSPQASRSAIK